MLKDFADVLQDHTHNGVHASAERRYVQRRLHNDDLNRNDSDYSEDINTENRLLGSTSTPIRVSSANSSNPFRKSMSDLKDLILLNPKTVSFGLEGSSQEEIDSPFSETSDSFLFNGSLFTLRILFVDLLIAFGNLSSDVLQGYTLFINNLDRMWIGLVALSIIWIPGIAAAIHLLAVYRREFPWYQTILYTILLILFYPIVPILALLIVLWTKPSGNKMTKEYMEVKYGATVAYAIHGCIESPIQIAYQAGLILSGIIPWQWNGLTSFTIHDWVGNEIEFTFATPMCIFFSIIT